MSEWQDQAMGSRRKDLPTNQKSREHLRFTPDDIVRAINGAQATGLQIYGVEITSTGSIKISTQPPARQPAAPDKQAGTNLEDETRRVKKQA
jgi:hypothetical protein